jgi:hypothetical protein
VQAAGGDPAVDRPGRDPASEELTTADHAALAPGKGGDHAVGGHWTTHTVV